MIDKSKLLHRPFHKGSWWALRKNYTLFMIREMTSFAVVGFAIMAILIVKSVKHDTFHDLLTCMQQPFMIILSAIAFTLLLYHSITSFLLAGRILYIPQGDSRVPPKMIAIGHFAAWFIISLIWWILFETNAIFEITGGH